MHGRSTKQRRATAQRRRLYRLAAQPVVRDQDLVRVEVATRVVRAVLGVTHRRDWLMREWVRL